MVMLRVGFSGDEVLVLTDREQGNILEWFKVIELYNDPFKLSVIDSHKRRFVTEGSPVWVHPDMQILPVLSPEPKILCTKYGYKMAFRVWVQNGCRLHRPDYMRDILPRLYNQLPEGVR